MNKRLLKAIMVMLFPLLCGATGATCSTTALEPIVSALPQPMQPFVRPIVEAAIADFNEKQMATTEQVKNEYEAKNPSTPVGDIASVESLICMPTVAPVKTKISIKAQYVLLASVEETLISCTLRIMKDGKLIGEKEIEEPKGGRNLLETTVELPEPGSYTLELVVRSGDVSGARTAQFILTEGTST